MKATIPDVSPMVNKLESVPEIEKVSASPSASDEAYASHRANSSAAKLAKTMSIVSKTDLHLIRTPVWRKWGKGSDNIRSTIPQGVLKGLKGNGAKFIRTAY